VVREGVGRHGGEWVVTLGRWAGTVEGGQAQWKVGRHSGRWAGTVEGGQAQWKVGYYGSVAQPPSDALPVWMVLSVLLRQLSLWLYLGSS
jgi:hypothetical protein